MWAGKLNEIMDFGHVILVGADGEVHDAPADVYAPELNDGELSGDGWELLNGYSGQYGYGGPIMHPSEFIGGRMAQDILSRPGLYVALVDYSGDESEADGWAVAYREE